MTIVNDNLAEISDGMLIVNNGVGLMVAWIPSGLVVDQKLDATLLGGGLHGAGMFHVHGQRFFHHDGDAVSSTHLDHTLVIKSTGKGGHGLDIGLLQQIFQGGVEKVGIEVVALGVTGNQLLIGFDNADQLNVAPITSLRDETAGVVMDKTDDGNTHRGLISLDGEG